MFSWGLFHTDHWKRTLSGHGLPRFLLATLTWRRGDVILAESGEQIDPFNFILVRGKQSELQTLSLIPRNPLNKTTFPVIPPKWKLFLMLVNRD